MPYSPEDVFKPGSYPELTYVSRNSDWEDTTYEDRLQLALKTSGFLTYLAGNSKMGKTILCKKVVPKGLISISGADFRTNEDIWSVIARQAGISMEGALTSGTSSANGNELATTTHFKRNKDEVIAYFKNNGYTLLIDDFHYAPETSRKIIAQQLKDAIGKEFKVIVVSLPHRADEAIRLNPDLSGRISVINLQPWEKDDLKSIASRGFDQLGVKYSDEILDYLAEASLSSPQLIQSVCLNIGLILGSIGPLSGSILTREICNKAFRRTTSNFEYRDVASFLKTGPVSRGNKRKKYTLTNGESKDLYELILDALAKDPPVVSIKIQELKNRIISCIDSETTSLPALGTIKSSLNHLISLMNTKETELFKVFDLKDDCLYVLDPQFLFYLRWGDRTNE